MFFFDIFGFSKNELCLLDEVTNAENIKADMKKVNNNAENVTNIKAENIC